MESKLLQAKRRSENLTIISILTSLLLVVEPQVPQALSLSAWRLCHILLLFLSPIKQVRRLTLECPFQAIHFVIRRSAGLEYDKMI